MEAMTREQFLDFACRVMVLTPEQFDQKYVVEPCTCGDGSCRGWAKIWRDWRSILQHRRHERFLAYCRATS